MFGIGVGKSFIDDWAAAAARSVDVAGVTVLPSSAGGVESVGRGLSYAVVARTPVVFVRSPRIRPKRVAWRLNVAVEMRRTIRAMDWLQRNIGPIDLLHTHFYAASSAVPPVAAALGVPYVVTEHSSRLVADPQFRTSSLVVMREVFGRAARVMFVSGDQLEFVKGLGIEGRFQVVPNPVSDALFTPRQPVAHPEVRLVTVGQLRDVKRQALLIEAFAEAQRAIPDLALEVIGEGPERAELERLVARQKLGSSVRLSGHLPRAEVAARLAESDVYAHTSETETFGVAIVEALFSGLPVVAVRAGGVTTELPESFGIVVDQGTPDDVAKAIVTVASNLGSYDRLRIAEESRRRFSADVVADQLGSIYREVVDEARG